MRRAILAALLGLTLAACSAQQLEHGALGSAKSWCRNSPQSCSVQDEGR